MASSLLNLIPMCASIIILLASSPNLASSSSSLEEAPTQFKVGDAFGWQQPPLNDTSFYTQWASMKRFHIGDSLVFEYKNDSVLSVEKWDYYHCDTSRPITAFNNGKTTVNFDRPGPFYFISGSHDQCINGQKLIVDVMSPHDSARSGPSVLAPSPSHLHHSTGDYLSVPLSFHFVLVAFGAVCLV